MRDRYKITTLDAEGKPLFGWEADIGDHTEILLKGAYKLRMERVVPQETYTAHAAARTIIRFVSFSDTSLAEAADFLIIRSRELRPPGLNVILIPSEIGQRRIRELSLCDTPLDSLARYIAESTGTIVAFEADAIVFRPSSIS